ncbi:MAG: cell division protein FtsQ/DivIB [Alphaproteobacteria bacterium]
MITLGKKKKGARRAYVRRPARKLDFFILWFKRFGIAFCVTGIVLWAGAMLWLNGSIDKAGYWTQNKVLDMTVDAGFSVENILVEGRRHVEPDILMAILDVQKGDPLFIFHPQRAQMQIEKISWVKSVLVERRFPDTIYVRLEEREPLALWQKDQKLYLVDREGKILTDHQLRRFEDLLMIYGENAPQHADRLIQTLRAEPEILARLESASWVGDRRWDLKSKNGILVKLPEQDIGLALRRLADTQSSNAILDKSLEHIDLRGADRIIVQTAPGKVQEYNLEHLIKAGFENGSDI